MSKSSFCGRSIFSIAPGVDHDMTKHGFEKDDWTKLFKKVIKADILILGTPIWLGEKSSVCSPVVERLYAESGKTNEFGQYFYNNRLRKIGRVR